MLYVKALHLLTLQQRFLFWLSSFVYCRGHQMKHGSQSVHLSGVDAQLRIRSLSVLYWQSEFISLVFME